MVDMASVRTNEIRSDYFYLFCSTRQGCPLSPLLFAIAVKPLSIALQSNPQITGVLRNGIVLKVSLFADDLLLYVFNLPVSVLPVFTTLKTFGKIFGYKLNFI